MAVRAYVRHSETRVVELSVEKESDANVARIELVSDVVDSVLLDKLLPLVGSD